MRLHWVLVGFALVSAGLAAACSGSGAAPSEGGKLELFDEMPDLQLSVALSEFHFDPATLELPAGQLVAITVRNEGSTEHDFTIKEIAGDVAFRLNGDPPSRDRGEGQDVHVALREGTSAELRIRATEPGEYELYCSVSGHRRAGMRTTLTVE